MLYNKSIYMTWYIYWAHNKWYQIEIRDIIGYYNYNNLVK